MQRRVAFISFWIAGTVLAASAAPAVDINLELRQRLPAENPAARLVYICSDCTLAEFAAIPLPGPNWEKNATATSARLFLSDLGTSTPPVLEPSVPTELDLVPTIPGSDLFLAAKVLSASFLGFDPILAVGMVEAQVARGTTLTWNPGRVIHKSVSPTGDEYVLFSIDEEYSEGFELDAVGGMTGVPLASGWTYTSELLTSPFVIETPTGVASVLAPSSGESAWQKIVVPPATAVPTVGWPAGGALIALLVHMGALRARAPDRSTARRAQME